VKSSATALAIGAGIAAFFIASRATASNDPSLPPSKLYKPGGAVTVPPMYAQHVNDAAAGYSVPYDVLARLLYTESRFRANAYNKSSGAIGIAQFLPDTANQFGVDPSDAKSSIFGAAKYLAYLYGRFNSWPWAVAAYNWGEGNVSRFLRDGFVITRKGTKITRAPSETRTYVAFIAGVTLA
jgi:soluble lytic murein transglycosylase-like protein